MVDHGVEDHVFEGGAVGGGQGVPQVGLVGLSGLGGTLVLRETVRRVPAACRMAGSTSGDWSIFAFSRKKSSGVSVRRFRSAAYACFWSSVSLVRVAALIRSIIIIWLV